ncbi:MAG: hypothetical protein IH940_11690 [Acidobacteria bacterium]|nr:hypothetical protein [Acidobacteriota bacterium]
MAVTGHRDLDPTMRDSVRRSVAAVIGGLADRCAPARVELLTGMADGADQIVTEVALELGCDVHVMLPKPREVYRAELSPEGAIQLDRVIESPAVEVSIISDTTDHEHGGVDPGLPYHRLGLHLAKSAHVLIALWDGQMERRSGGTLDVLASYLDRDFGPEPSGELPDPVAVGEVPDALEGPTAVWVPSARLGAAGQAEQLDTTPVYVIASGRGGVWHGQAAMPTALTSMLDDLAELTVDMSSGGSQPAGYSLLEALPDDLDIAERLALDEVQSAYLAADGLAMANQSLSDRAFIAATLIGAGMGFAFLWFAKIDDHLAWLYAYLALFLVGYILFRTTHSRRWLHQHLSRRVLAENLRVRFFVLLLGMSDRVDVRRVMTETGVSSFPGFAWARESDRVGVPLPQSEPRELAERYALVDEHWVDDQATYFGRKVRQLEIRHAGLEFVQRVLYVLSFLAVVVIIIFGTDLKTVYVPGHVSLKAVLIFLMGLLPLWLTLWELHQGRMATRELLWQFRNQATVFGRASSDLGRGYRDEVRQQIYVDLAERSLFETYLWTIHRYHREFPAPSGG